MRKGSTGICLAYIAALAFLLVIFNQPMLCGLVMLASIFIEKDEWLGRQTLQAFLLLMSVNFLSSLLTALTLVSFIQLSFLPLLVSLLSGIVYLIALIVAIVSIIRCVREQEADIPILSGFAYRAYGFIRPVYTPPVQQQYYQAPAQQQPPYQPSQQQSPIGNPQQQQTGSPEQNVGQQPPQQ